jgi:hypothetical protein
MVDGTVSWANDQAHRQASENPETLTSANACSVLRPCSPVDNMESVEEAGLGFMDKLKIAFGKSGQKLAKSSM